MSDTPDPPTVTPDVRSWITRFFDAIGWTEQIADDIAQGQENAAAEAAFDAIADVRANRRITDSRGGRGTVSITEVNGQTYVGVNSTNFTEEDRALAQSWENALEIPAGPAGRFARQVLYHAEAHTLMQIHRDSGGQMPAEMTIYVDRIACSACQNTLPDLVRVMGIETLTVRLDDGRIATVTSDGFFGDWQ